MDCGQVQGMLGRFHDGELTAIESRAVEAHLDHCSACAAELAGLAELGQMFRSAAPPEPPSALWDQMADRLARGVLPGRRPRSSRLALRLTTVAALFVVAVATGWTAFGPKFPLRRVAQPEIDILRLLDQGAERPRNDIAGVAQTVDFQVLQSPRLPRGYRLVDRRTVVEGGCPVVLSRYNRGSEQVVLCQYQACLPARQSVDSGTRVRIHGKDTQVTDCRDGLLATWKVKGTAVSLAGPRDLSEINELVRYVDAQLEGTP